ncbi:MAG: 50S ribosomal protein L25/general stress protein Ctc [Verrucomicrobia bacterium]|nr:50S ribosomal protein L25/general stress protein Ctc [Verrucomicrobiota bacterium]MBS0646617.1 50S ribosomal protein L25/general stress protein Ctc [Verrucomicrobiota bacterium]
MKFHVKNRQAASKSVTKQIRREGNIPAVLYSKGEKGKEITVDGIVFKKLLDSIEPGTLSSKVLTLDLEGKEIKAIVKDIQYHVTTYRVLHLDLEQLHDDTPVSLNIPIKCVGGVDCVGVKLGGVLRQIIRYVKVRALPKHIPAHFELDVRQLGLRQSMRLSSLSVPAGVELRSDLKEVAVVVN